MTAVFEQNRDAEIPPHRQDETAPGLSGAPCCQRRAFLLAFWAKEQQRASFRHVHEFVLKRLVRHVACMHCRNDSARTHNLNAHTAYPPNCS